MAYIAPIHRSSSVRHALSVRLLSAEEPSLVVAKSNRLEVWRLSQGQLSLLHSRTVFGNICMLQALQPKDSDTEMLYIGTDRFRYFTMAWNPDSQDLETVQSLKDVGERFLRDAATKNKCLVDPSGRFLVMLLWSGVLSVMRLPARKGHQGQHTKLEDMDQARISELYIRSATFLHSETGHPRLAFLYQNEPDGDKCMLVAYRLCANDADTEVSRFDPQKDRLFGIPIKEPGASLLIPVQREQAEKRHNFRNQSQAHAQLGGLIVVGESQLLYVDDASMVRVVTSLPSANIFVAWEKLDNTHYFLGDEYGGLHLLSILVEPTQNSAITDLRLDFIGKAPRASELVCMTKDGTNFLFVASHYGDSQLLRVNLLQSTEAGPRSMLEVVHTMPNLAPILDFTVMDMGNREGDSRMGNEYSSGQARIVTGSGAHRDGSLRSVRSGVGLEDVGVIGPFPHVRCLFPVRSHGVPHVDTLVASCLTETRVLRFDAAGDIEELTEFQGLDLSNESLLVATLPDGRIIQVTGQSATIIDDESRVVVSSWSPDDDRQITHASANDRWLLLGVDGRILVSLDLEENLRLAAKSPCGDDEQISCLNASPHMTDLGAVGFWNSGSVAIVRLGTLEAAQSPPTLSDGSVPHDILLVRVHPVSIGAPTLLVAMADGEVINFTVQPDGKLTSRRAVILGTYHARFHVLPLPGGICNVFATSEHSSLIYSAEGRLAFSAVTAEPATVVCPFEYPGFPPDTLAVVTETQLKFSRVDKHRKSHIRSLEMGETVRCIAYSLHHKLFGLGCVKRDFAKGVEKVTSTFRLVDEVVFKPLGRTFKLNDGELVECVQRAQLEDAYGNPAERFLVGTRAIPQCKRSIPGESVGRILVFGVDADKSPYLIMSHNVKSGCRRLAVLNVGDETLVVAVLTKTVVLAHYRETSLASASLEKVASYQTSSYAVDVAVKDDLIAVADLMKSITVLQYSPKSAAPPQLTEKCRHYSAVWATAVCHVDSAVGEGEQWLVSDADGNLLVLQQNHLAATADDGKRMRVTSEIGLGESVNQVKNIQVESSPNALVRPKAFLATVEGSIYMFGTIAPKSTDLLLRFQASLVNHLESPGQIPFNDWRSFRSNEREGDGPVRFLDGEILERFLDMDEEKQALVCEDEELRDLRPTVEGMRNMVEELRSMH